MPGCGTFSGLRLPSGLYGTSPGPAGGFEVTIDGCPFSPKIKLESALRLRSWGAILANRNGMREIMGIVTLRCKGVCARLALSYQSPREDEVT